MSEQFKEVHKSLIALCDQFEQLWLERQAMRVIIAAAQIPGWEADFSQAKADTALQEQARNACRSMRQSLLDETAWAYLESSESVPPTSSLQ
jgi:hypothetical protein